MEPNPQYNVIHTLFNEDLQKINSLLKERNIVFIYVHKKDYPDAFFSYIAKTLNVNAARDLRTSSKDNLPYDLYSEDASSLKFLSSSGLEIWWVSSNSPPRVHEVVFKLLKSRWSKSMVILTTDYLWFSHIRTKISSAVSKSLLTLQPLQYERLTRYAEYYAASIGCEELRCFNSLKNIQLEVHMLDVEMLVQQVKEAIAICTKVRSCESIECSGLSRELAESMLVHFNQDSVSLLTSLRGMILDFISWLYPTKEENNFQGNVWLREIFDYKSPLDSLVFVTKLRDISTICLDAENGYIVLPPRFQDVVRSVNIRCIAEAVPNMIGEEKFFEIFSSLETDLDKYKKLRTLINRWLLDNVTLDFGVLLWFINELNNIFPEARIQQSIVYASAIANLSENNEQYSFQWNRALDFFQNLDRLSFPRDLIIALFSRYLIEEKTARLVAENLLQNLLERSIDRLQNLLHLYEEAGDFEISIRDSLCDEICDGIGLLTDLRITLSTEKIEKVVELFKKLILSINYQMPNYEWDMICAKILSASISICKNNKLKIRITSFISESLRFEKEFDSNTKDLQKIEQVFYSLKERTEDRSLSNLNISLKLIDMILDFWSTMIIFNEITPELSDAAKLKRRFEKLYFAILIWVLERKKLGVPSSLLIYDIVCQAFGLFKSTYISSEVNRLISEEFNDIVLLVVDAMPIYFSKLFQKSKKLNSTSFLGFSVIPSETAPGHVSLFTGMPPVETGIFENTVQFAEHSVSLIDSRKSHVLPDQLKKVSKQTITHRLRNVGIGTSIFTPSNYSKSLLSKILLGENLQDVEIHECKKGIDLFKEASMIPINNDSKRFYVVLDNEIDVTQHAGLKRYYFDEKEERRLYHHYAEYFDKIISFLIKINQNANLKGRKILIIITADHGVAIFRYIESSFIDLLNICGLDFVSFRGRNVKCPEPTKLKGGIYSKYDLTLFENPQICQRIGLNRKEAQSSRIAFTNIHNIYRISRAVLIYTTNSKKFHNLKLVSMTCDNCRYEDSVAISGNSLCPKCGASNPNIVEIGTLKSELLKRAEELKFHIFLPESASTNASGGITYPELIVFPKFDSIISKYPHNPRESIMYLLQLEKKPLSRSSLLNKYIRLKGINYSRKKVEEDFDKALRDLTNLRFVDYRKNGYIIGDVKDYTGVCTVISHGGTSPSETIVPFVILKN